MPDHGPWMHGMNLLSGYPVLLLVLLFAHVLTGCS